MWTYWVWRTNVLLALHKISQPVILFDDKSWYHCGIIKDCQLYFDNFAQPEIGSRGLTGHSQLFKASHANVSQPGHCFPLCACSFQCFPKQRVHCQRNAPFPGFPRDNRALLHHYTSCLYSFISVNNACCCHHVVFRSYLHGSDWSKWLWPICRVCPENFPAMVAKGLKILPIT